MLLYAVLPGRGSRGSSRRIQSSSVDHDQRQQWWTWTTEAALWADERDEDEDRRHDDPAADSELSEVRAVVSRCVPPLIRCGTQVD